MSVLLRLAWSYIAKNKTKTIFIVCGTALSIILLFITNFFIFSYQEYLYKQDVYIRGDYLLSYNGEEREELPEYIQNVIDKEIYVSNLGYVKQDSSYISLKGADTFEGINFIKLINGMYPTSEEEILVSKNYKIKNNVELNDTINVHVGKRIQNGEEVQAMDLVNGENFQEEFSKSYRITGFYDVDTVINATAIKDEMMTLSNQKYQSFQCFLKLDINESEWTLIKQKLQTTTRSNFVINEAVEQRMFTHKSVSISNILAIAIIVIMYLLTMVSMIKNVFQISISEQMKQIGILTSVGATKRQILGLSCLEGIIYAMFALPIGILISVITTKLLFEICNSQLSIVTDMPFALELSYDWKIILCCIVSIFLTLMLSAILPARN